MKFQVEVEVKKIYSFEYEAADMDTAEKELDNMTDEQLAGRDPEPSEYQEVTEIYEVEGDGTEEEQDEDTGVEPETL